MRINKFLAHAGVASRRKAEELILSGKVSVNNVTMTNLGYQVESGDSVEVNGVGPSNRYGLTSLRKRAYLSCRTFGLGYKWPFVAY